MTKTSNDAYATARRNQRRALADKRKAVEAIAKKLALPVASAAERKALVTQEQVMAKQENRKSPHLSFGYRSRDEHAMKRRRLQVLRSQCIRLEADIATGRVHVTRGGKKMLRNRLHLEEAGLTEDQWRTRWRAARLSFGANGEAEKLYGNETVRLSPGGNLEVDLPGPLAHLANVTARGTTRYRLSCSVSFSNRRDEWLAQVSTNRACAYDVVFSARGRVYLDASFTPAEVPEVPDLDELLSDPTLRVLAVDLNAGFVAPAVLDRSGNPLELCPHVPVVTEDLPATTRDGHLREAVSRLLDLAEAYGCALVVVENLGFDDMRTTGRERYGSRKSFRKTVCGIPTSQFRDRLAAMASRRGIAVAGVHAAYSSIWGEEHWQEPLCSKHHKVSKHTAAAVVLGRRALGQLSPKTSSAHSSIRCDRTRPEDRSGSHRGVRGQYCRCGELPRRRPTGTTGSSPRPPPTAKAREHPSDSKW